MDGAATGEDPGQTQYVLAPRLSGPACPRTKLVVAVVIDRIGALSTMEGQKWVTRRARRICPKQTIAILRRLMIAEYSMPLLGMHWVLLLDAEDAMSL